MKSATFDFKEVMTRFLKYLLEGLVVAFAIILIPSKTKMEPMEVFLIATIAATTFSTLDLFAPSIGISMRQGAGFGMGANLVRFPA